MTQNCKLPVTSCQSPVKTSRESRTTHNRFTGNWKLETGNFARARGFTLLELLVALTIFAVISTTIYASLSTGINIWKRTTGHEKTYQSAGILMDIFERDISNAIDIRDIPFAGTKTSLEFAALKSVYDTQTKSFKQQIHRIRYHVEGESGEGSLYRFESPFPHERPLDTKGTRMVTHIENVEFQYYGYQFKAGDEESWEDKPPWEWLAGWDSPGKLPRAVRFNLIMDPQNENTAKVVLDRKFRLPAGSGEHIPQET